MRCRATAAAALCATLATRAAVATPRTVVVMDPSAWGSDLGRMTEALQVYLRDFGATVRPADDPAAEARAVAARGEADFTAIVSVDQTRTRVHVVISDLRGARAVEHASDVDLARGVSDEARHVALLVRAELAAAARAPRPSEPPPSVVAAPVASPPAPGRVTAAGAGAFGASTLGGHVELGLALLLGQTSGRRFAGVLAEVGREQPRDILGRGEITRAALGIDLRPGRLVDWPRWTVLWGGQAGASFTRTYLIGDETRVWLADTFSAFVRGGLWSWHRVGPRLTFAWEVGAELLPLATEVKAGPEPILSSGHVRPRLSITVLVDL